VQPGASPGHRLRERWALSLASAVLLGLWLLRWPLRSRYPYEWDSASYLLGAAHFDVYRHHPHPPGYPLYILSLKIAHLFSSDVHAAAVAFALLLTLAAAALLSRFARARYGEAAGIFAPALLLFAPPVVLYSVIASSYPFDLLGSALVGWLAARLWDGEGSIGPWLVLALAAHAGFRESGAVMMTPLVVVALARAYGRSIVRWGACLAIGAAATASWYVPVAMMHGGIVPYQQFCDRTIRSYFRHVSVLFGAPRAMHVAMLHNVERWAFLTFVVALAVSIAVWALGRGAPGSTSRAPLRPPAAFYALWTLPNLLYVTLFQCIKPGYLLLFVPPVVLLLAWGTAPSFEAMAVRTRMSVRAVGSVFACVAALSSTAVACHHFESLALRRASLASAWEGDEETAAIESRVDPESDGARETMVVYFSFPWYGPTPQAIMLRYPEATVGLLLPSGSLETHRYGEVLDETGAAKPVPADVRNILWICETGRQGRLDVTSSVPGTRVVYEGRSTTAFLTDVGDAPVDAVVRYEGTALHLSRASP
jgi:hypothetical protein